MDIEKFLKPGKNIVIEIEEVEYLVNDEVVELIKKGEESIELRQLYDGQNYLFTIQEIEGSLVKNGVVDYLDKRTTGTI